MPGFDPRRIENPIMSAIRHPHPQLFTLQKTCIESIGRSRTATIFLVSKDQFYGPESCPANRGSRRRAGRVARHGRRRAIAKSKYRYEREKGYSIISLIRSRTTSWLGNKISYRISVCDWTSCTPLGLCMSYRIMLWCGGRATLESSWADMRYEDP